MESGLIGTILHRSFFSFIPFYLYRNEASAQGAGFPAGLCGQIHTF